MANGITFNHPFPEQVDFFKRKLNLPTKRFDQITRSAHDHAFVVAGGQQSDFLADMRYAVDLAITQGETLEQFRKHFDDIVSRNGWAYNGSRNWRTSVIYLTNLRTSYAAGRYAQLTDPASLAARPYWRYVHSDDVLVPRPEHLAWNGLVLDARDPWWNTHYPPNGWGCMCTVQAVAADELPKSGPDESPTEPGDNTGIGKGWDYALGQSAADTANLVDLKVTAQAGRDEAIARAYTERLMADGAYQSWYDTIERQVAALASKTDGMDAGDAVNFLRNKKNIPDQGSWPVAVLTTDAQGWFGLDSSARTVNFSTDTAIKQIYKRGDDFKADDYKLLQEIMDSAELVTQDRELHAVYFHRAGKVYEAVLKVTQDKKSVYLQTFFQSSQRASEKAKEKGRVLRDLEK